MAAKRLRKRKSRQQGGFRRSLGRKMWWRKISEESRSSGFTFLPSPLCLLRLFAANLITPLLHQSITPAFAGSFSCFTPRPLSPSISSVDVMTFQKNRPETKPHPKDFGIQPANDLEAAIERSQNYLLSEQKPEGYWIGELMVDATLVADTVAYHHWNGKVDERWQRKAVNHIFSMQLPDGGWNIYYGGPAEVNATIKCYLALKLGGGRRREWGVLRARRVAVDMRAVP